MADIDGTEFNDNLVGTNGPDTIRGFGGNDTLLGRDGDDYLLSGSGVDSLVGGNGDDQLSAGPDNDTLFGNNGNDIVDGGSGSDVLIGSGQNIINGEQDRLIGRTGSDQFVLGNNFGSLYLGNDSFATIRDFERSEGDKVVLNGSASNYRLSIGNFGSATFIRTNNNNLIGVLEGVTNFSLTTDAIFV